MAYSFNRRRGAQACIGAAMLSLAAAFIGVGSIFPVRVLGIPMMLFGILIALLAASLILDIFAPNPILTVSAEGLYFLPFSPTTVPWSEVTSVTVSHGYYYGTGGVTGPDGKSGVSYAIRDPSMFPKRSGIAAIARATMSGNTVMLNTATLIDASGDAILVAIREHYKDTITDRPIPGASSAP